MSRFFSSTLLLLGFGAGAGHAQAVNADRAALALGGYDPVPYHSAGAPQKGRPEFTATHGGATYRFASAEHRDAFVRDPECYLPAYGGFCAYGMSRGYRAKIDPEAFTVVDGKLYLNYDKGVRARWSKDIPGHIIRADSNWARTKDQPAD